MTRYIRKTISKVLAAVGLAGSNRYDIDWIDGFQEPKVVYEATSYHYETMGGRIIRYPSAYKKKGWSNIRYVAATRGKIRVGKGWVIQETA